MYSGEGSDASESWERLYDVMDGGGSFEERSRRALTLGTQVLNADHGLLVRTDPDSDHWKAVVSTEPADAKLHEGVELAFETTYCRRVVETESQVTLHDAPNQEWDDDPAFDAHGYHCYLGTPVYLDDEPYGTVCFIADEPRAEFSTNETLFAELVARLIERELELKQHTAEITDKTNLAAALARVLRHNIRNSLTVIRGYIQEMGTDAGDTDYHEIVLREVDTLLELSERARDLEQILTEDAQPTLTDVVPVIDEITDTVTAEHPAATATVHAPDEVVLPIRPSFERAIEELVENAVRHGGEDPTISITVESAEDAVEIRIRDDGSGLPEMEQTAIETGETTPLTHGIGLGLWMVRWIVSRHDGTVESTVTDGGTTITIALPETPESAEQTGITEITRARDQYKAAFDEASEAMIIFNDDARIVDLNPRAATIYGNDRHELLGREVADFLPDDYDFEAAWATFQEAKAGDDENVENVVEFVGDDGEKRVVEYSTVPEIVPGQHLMIVEPITGTEADSGVYEQIFNQTYQFTGLMRPDGTLIEANETALEFGGLDRDDVIGEKMWETRWFQQSQRTREQAREAVERAAEGEFIRRDLVVSGADREATIDFSIRPVTDDQGNVRLLIPEGRDVTERRRGTVQ
jgi:PAS domain S-box-containing protein